MFVCGGVEDIARSVCSESLFHAGTVDDVADEEAYRDFGVLRFHLKLKVVHRSLGLIDEDNLACAERCDLIDNFAAYRAGGACYQHNLIGYDAPDGRAVGLYRVTPEKVFNLDVVDVS